MANVMWVGSEVDYKTLEAIRGKCKIEEAKPVLKIDVDKKGKNESVISQITIRDNTKLLWQVWKLWTAQPDSKTFFWNGHGHIVYKGREEKVYNVIHLLEYALRLDNMFFFQPCQKLPASPISWSVLLNLNIIFNHKPYLRHAAIKFNQTIVGTNNNIVKLIQVKHILTQPYNSNSFCPIIVMWNSAHPSITWAYEQKFSYTFIGACNTATPHPFVLLHDEMYYSTFSCHHHFQHSTWLHYLNVAMWTDSRSEWLTHYLLWLWIELWILD